IRIGIRRQRGIVGSRRYQDMGNIISYVVWNAVILVIEVLRIRRRNVEVDGVRVSNVGVRRVDRLAQGTTTWISRAGTVIRAGRSIDYQGRIIIDYCSRGCAGTADGVASARSHRQSHCLVRLEGGVRSRIDGHGLSSVSSAKAYRAARRIECRGTALRVVGIEGGRTANR